MFKINADTNDIAPLKIESFSNLGFEERRNLQEWIAKRPSCLGEELLIIQKEFSGFSDTQERLDLLALDKDGALVVIENKLDDTGRDVTWQALKYASYCSQLTTDDIAKIYQDFLTKSGSTAKAEDALLEFFDVQEYRELTLNKGITQRIILVAANFRKEVTSTVLWLLNFNLQLKCFKATPYSMNDQLFLSLEQIIPTKDAEEFMIGLAAKAQDEVQGATEEKNRHIVRRAFWTQLLSGLAGKTGLYQNISPGVAGWIGAGSGVRGVGFNFSAGKAYGRAEVYIHRGDRDENKWIFDELEKRKNEIETSFGEALVWERLDDKQACRIKSEIAGSIFDRDQWSTMIQFMTDAMPRMEQAFRAPLDDINLQLRTKSRA